MGIQAVVTAKNYIPKAQTSKERVTVHTRKPHLWLAILMVLSLVLAACGQQGGGNNQQTGTTPTVGAAAAGGTTPTTGAAPATDTTPALGDGTVAPGAATAPTGAGQQPTAAECPDTAQGAQITYWNGFSGEDGPFMTALVNNFNKQNGKGITVKQTIQPYPEYYNKLNAAVASNTLPDVAQIHIDQIATNAVRGLIRPIPQEVQDVVGLTAQDYPPTLWQGTEYKGQHYAYPLDVHGLVMYYNKQVAEQAGVNVTGGEPLSNEDYEKLLQAGNKGGKMGWPITGGFPNAWMFLILLNQFGGSPFNENGTQVAWNSEAGVKALTYLRDQQKKYSGNKPLPPDADDVAMEKGNAAVVWSGTWSKPRLTGEGKPGSSTLLPQVGSQYKVHASAHTLAMPKQKTEDPKRMAAAGCFISFMVSNSLPWVQGGGHVPAVNSVRQSEEFQNLQPQSNYAQFAEAAVFLPQVPGITDATGPEGLEAAVINVLSGKSQDIKGELDRAADRGNRILERNRQRYGGGQ